MSGLEPLMLASLAATAAGTATSAYGTVMQGKAADAAGKYEAAQQQRAAREDRAAGQRSAMEQRTEAEQVMSRQRALAAASGAGAANPTILDLLSDTAERGELLASTEQYKGESHARGRLDQAKAARFRGKAALKGSYLEAFGEIGKGAGAIAGKMPTKPGGGGYG